MCTIILSDTADAFLGKLPRDHKEVILRRLHTLRDDPFHYLKRLSGESLWRMRIMEYRAIVDVIVRGKEVYVVRIGHRKNVYD